MRKCPCRWCRNGRICPQKTVLEGVKGPLFGLIVMPFANMVEPDSPLPVSLFAGAMESIMEFDQVYSELLYELHSGRRKNIIERTAIVPEGKRKRIRGVCYQDPATDTYILDPAEEHSPFQDYSPSIRTEEYLAGMRAILHMIENQCHLSPGSLALDDRTGALTATQVISQDRTTYHTCAAIEQHGLTPAIRQLSDAVEGSWGIFVICYRTGKWQLPFYTETGYLRIPSRSLAAAFRCWKRA